MHIHCDFLNLGLSVNSRDVSVTMSHSVLIFLLNASQMTKLVSFGLNTSLFM